MFCLPFKFNRRRKLSPPSESPPHQSDSDTPPLPEEPLTQPDDASAPVAVEIQDGSPTKRALLIGISEYPHLLPHQQLPGSTNDVTLVYDLLTKRFSFPKRNITCLRNEQATRDGLLKAFQELIAATKQDDVVVIHYSGHGAYIRDSSKGAGWTETIVPYDSGRKPSKHRNTDIKDTEISECLLEPLIRKTPFVTLVFDSCHSGSILREVADTTFVATTPIRGIDPDGEIRDSNDIEDALTSRWLPPTPTHVRDLTHERYTLLAACRANEKAAETFITGTGTTSTSTTTRTAYGAFTYHLCNLLSQRQHHEEPLRSLFQLASTNVTAAFPNQHPILEGAQNAMIFGSTHLETPRYLGIRRTFQRDGTTMVEMDGGLASGVVRNSVWAVKPVTVNAEKSSDLAALVKVEETLPFTSFAQIVRPGEIKPEYGCFEISHVYGEAALNVFLEGDDDPRFNGFRSLLHEQPNVSGALNILSGRDSPYDVRLVFIKQRSHVSESDILPQLGALHSDTCVALSPDGRLLLPPTPNSTDFTDLSENLRKLARYRFGLGLHNLDDHRRNYLRGKLSLELKWRPSSSSRYDPWFPARLGADGFPFYSSGDQIACVIKNNNSPSSKIKVWPYILEFAEDGSVTQRYPGRGGEEGLEPGSETNEVARMKLAVSEDNAFQLAESKGRESEHGQKRRVTEVLKLFAATEPIDLSLLLQTSFVHRDDECGLADLLRKGSHLDEEEEVVAWQTVDAPFVLEF